MAAISGSSVSLRTPNRVARQSPRNDRDCDGYRGDGLVGIKHVAGEVRQERYLYDGANVWSDTWTITRPIPGINESGSRSYVHGLGTDQMLARRGHDPETIDGAVTRLKADRAIDDTRVAETIVRTQTTVKHRGKMRVLRQLEAAGIAPDTAHRAIDAAFSEMDDDTLIVAALARRLRGRTTIADERELGRLYRFLVGQGFEAERVLAVLKRHQPPE